MDKDVHAVLTDALSEYMRQYDRISIINGYIVPLSRVELFAKAKAWLAENEPK